ncbi:MAG: type II toxin-antitoxin system VapC family toxin [Desulfobaccales bacterium]
MMDKIAIDSNILSYFVDVTLPNYDPLNDHESLRNEKISTLRIALYDRDTRLYILPLVEIEWRCISDTQRRFLHSMGKLVVFSSRPWRIDSTKLKQLIAYLLKNHPKEKDCQLLAEAELTGMKIILTNDNDFIKNLSNKTTVMILRPSEYLKKLNIKMGTPPIRRPDKSNPLIHKT